MVMFMMEQSPEAKSAPENESKNLDQSLPSFSKAVARFRLEAFAEMTRVRVRDLFPYGPKRWKPLAVDPVRDILLVRNPVPPAANHR